MSQKTVRFGVCGNVDSGKSTISGILAKLPDGVYDDGRGYARSLMFAHKHEHQTGRTSSITRESKVLGNIIHEFVDLAGHEMYLKTTVNGLCGHNIDYILLIVAANVGLSKMTKEHLRLSASLRYPIIIVVTKIDLTPPNILLETMNSIKRYIKDVKAFSHHIKSDKDFESNILKQFLTEKFERFLPIFCVSNKTGEGIDLLKKFLYLTDPVQKFDSQAIPVFNIHMSYCPPGIGLVVSGIIQSGSIHKGDKLELGPIQRLKQFVSVKVWSIHDDFRNTIDRAEAGMTCSLAIKILDKNLKNMIDRDDIRRGCKIVKEPRLIKSFLAQVYIFGNKTTTIIEGYEPVLSCMTSVQVAKIIKVFPNDQDDIKFDNNQIQQKDQPKSTNGKKEDFDSKIKSSCVLRVGERGNCVFEFKYTPEYLDVGNLFIFREGMTKGIGKIKNIYE